MTMITRFAVFLAGTVAFSVWTYNSCGATPTSRTEFAKAFAAISDGMSQQVVAQILGQPDEKRGSTVGDLEVWEYGTDGPNTLPTLGSISFDGEHRVVRVIGGSCATPPQNMFDEQELRGLLRLVHRPVGLTYGPCPTMDPQKLIELVNSIQPLGKEKVLALAKEYLRITRRFDDGRIGLGLALLVVFDVPDEPGFLPPLVTLPIRPAPSANFKQSPRYPIALVDDVPVLLVREVAPFGQGPLGLNWSTLFALQDSKYRVRQRPLVPKSDPFDLPAALKQSQPWFFAPFQIPGRRSSRQPPSGEKVIGKQVLSLVRTVLDPPPDFDEWCEEDFQQRWATTRTDFLELRARWDEKRYMYTK